jgi:hypothetical protein
MTIIIAKRLTPEEKIEFDTSLEYYPISRFSNINNLIIEENIKERFNIDEEYFKDLLKNSNHEVVCGGVFELIHDNKHEYEIIIRRLINH